MLARGMTQPMLGPGVAATTCEVDAEGAGVVTHPDMSIANNHAAGAAGRASCAHESIDIGRSIASADAPSLVDGARP